MLEGNRHHDLLMEGEGVEEGMVVMRINLQVFLVVYQEGDPALK